MSTVFETVNRYIFDEMARLDAIDPSDEALGHEIERARAIGAMARVAVENAGLALEATRIGRQVGVPPAKLLAHGDPE